MQLYHQFFGYVVFHWKFEHFDGLQGGIAMMLGVQLEDRFFHQKHVLLDLEKTDNIEELIELKDATRLQLIPIEWSQHRYQVDLVHSGQINWFYSDGDACEVIWVDGEISLGQM